MIKAIYYLNGRDREMTSASPYMEIFKEKTWRSCIPTIPLMTMCWEVSDSTRRKTCCCRYGAVDLKAKEEEGDTGKEDRKCRFSGGMDERGAG